MVGRFGGAFSGLSSVERIPLIIGELMLPSLSSSSSSCIALITSSACCGGKWTSIR